MEFELILDQQLGLRTLLVDVIFLPTLVNPITLLGWDPRCRMYMVSISKDKGPHK